MKKVSAVLYLSQSAAKTVDVVLARPTIRVEFVR